jgi:hypothetical protein
MTFDADAWREHVRRHRAEKDAFLAEHNQSPIPPAHREAFDGLEYYPPDPDFRVEATVDRSADPQSVRMDTTAGRTVTYRRIARLRFDLGGDERALAVYHQEGQHGLFLPFTDATTGEATYERGRYLDLEIDPAELAERASIVVDFNEAYSPFCAYSDTYDCPIPPEENHLAVAVEAGEKAWHP